LGKATSIYLVKNDSRLVQWLQRKNLLKPEGKLARLFQPVKYLFSTVSPMKLQDTGQISRCKLSKSLYAENESAKSAQQAQHIVQKFFICGYSVYKVKHCDRRSSSQDCPTSCFTDEMRETFRFRKKAEQ
jgi:hypothetical protein